MKDIEVLRCFLKKECIYMYITEPLCYITEIGTTLSINHTSIKKIFLVRRGEKFK